MYPAKGIFMLPVSVEFAIGSLTGLLDCVLFHWIDTLKVRRQDGRPLLLNVRTGRALSPNASFFARINSLYAGFSTNLSLKVPYMASMFAFNALNTRLLEGPLSSTGSNVAVKEFTAAALVGVQVSLLLSPLEMVRIQGQNNGKGGLFSATSAVAATAKGEGLAGWWRAWTRGMTATMHREAKYCAGQFFLCAKISEHVSAYFNQVESTVGAQAPRETLASQLAGATLGGIACTVISHPDDVAKTRMQTHIAGSPLHSAYATFSGTLLKVAREEGVSALFRGAAFRCLLRVPLGLSVIIVSGDWMRKQAERRLSTPM